MRRFISSSPRSSSVQASVINGGKNNGIALTNSRLLSLEQARLKEKTGAVGAETSGITSIWMEGMRTFISNLWRYTVLPPVKKQGRADILLYYRFRNDLSLMPRTFLPIPPFLYSVYTRSPQNLPSTFITESALDRIINITIATRSVYKEDILANFSQNVGTRLRVLECRSKERSFTQHDRLVLNACKYWQRIRQLHMSGGDVLSSIDFTTLLPLFRDKTPDCGLSLFTMSDEECVMWASFMGLKKSQNGNLSSAGQLYQLGDWIAKDNEMIRRGAPETLTNRKQLFHALSERGLLNELLEPSTNQLRYINEHVDFTSTLKHVLNRNVRINEASPTPIEVSCITSAIVIRAALS